ncbi:hypothetical protein ALC60_01538, partial [Trachymyrmex zeteki]
NGSTFCPIHPRESSVSRGNSCGGIRNSRFVEVRLSTRYGTMISNQRTSMLVHADTHADLSCAWPFKYDCSLIRYQVIHLRSFRIVRFARGLHTLVKSRSLKRGTATSGTESCSFASLYVRVITIPELVELPYSVACKYVRDKQSEIASIARR